MREYVSADFTHEGKDLHKTKKLKKDVYNKNNARNRDAYSITKSNDMLKGEKEIVSGSNRNRSTNLNETENTLITLIDLKSRAKRDV